ncbi:Metallo-dependent phosphatase-like protein [Hyaloraphidium curvatum]|nr:Metallo-dependent phosphatase-like protein [Hyaloraphidium curvatum]
MAPRFRAVLFPKAPKPRGAVRCVAISDTHTRHRDIRLPPADVLVHGGDFTFNGRREEVADFVEWLKTLTHIKYKVVIAGNHDFTFDPAWYAANGASFHARDLATLSPFEKRVHEYFERTSGHKLFTEGPLEDATSVKGLLDNAEMRRLGIFYLEDSGVIAKTVSAGGVEELTIRELEKAPPPEDFASGQQFRIWGSPHAPDFHSWALMRPRNTGELEEKYSLVPPDTDLLISHSPPMGILDRSNMTGENVGCEALRALIDSGRVDMAVNVFGHIHEAFGTEEHAGVLCINAAMSEPGYKTDRRTPPVFDFVPITEEHSL